MRHCEKTTPCLFYLSGFYSDRYGNIIEKIYLIEEMTHVETTTLEYAYKYFHGDDYHWFMGYYYQYNPCCIEYFIKIWPYITNEERVEARKHFNDHVLCPKCIKK